MKKILLISGLMLLFSLLLAPVILAQDNGPGLPDTAVGGVNWLFSQIDGWTALILGLISSQVTKLGKKYLQEYLPEQIRESVLSSIIFGVSAIVPPVLTYAFTLLVPAAEFLDSSGYWAVVVAVWGSSLGAHIIEEKFFFGKRVEA